MRVANGFLIRICCLESRPIANEFEQKIGTFGDGHRTNGEKPNIELWMARIRLMLEPDSLSKSSAASIGWLSTMSERYWESTQSMRCGPLEEG
jgi:hypothetical protein